jgi:hypothetical protein
MRITATGRVSIGASDPTSGKLYVEGGSTTAIFAHNTSANATLVADNDSSGTGLAASSQGGKGVDSYSETGTGVYGQTNSGTAIFGVATSGAGFAGYFQGKVQVTGTLSKGGGSFKIDHPLDPENKYLYHSFVESPDMLNIYNGNVTTDANGEAEVTLPDYFAALNRDFRYQLTVIGQFAQAIINSKVKDNHFTIKTDKPNVEVSWQVTGIRQDPFANANRIPVEELKPEAERGTYLYPTAFGQSELMKKTKDQREQAQRNPPQEQP